jgi:hypothetical protein
MILYLKVRLTLPIDAHAMHFTMVVPDPATKAPRNACNTMHRAILTPR